MGRVVGPSLGFYLWRTDMHTISSEKHGTDFRNARVRHVLKEGSSGTINLRPRTQLKDERLMHLHNTSMQGFVYRLTDDL